MRYSVEQLDAGIVIMIANSRKEDMQIIDAIRNCSKAIERGCTVECGKIATIEESSQGDTLVLRMMPRTGEHIEIDTVRRCLQVLWRTYSGDES